MYYSKYNRKKEIIKNTIIIGFILFIAVFSTYHIYYKFTDNTKIDYSSESLDITFHEPDGEELDIVKVIPLNDSVGLSSNTHTISIKNNLTEPVNYKIKLVDNTEKMLEQNCEGITIPRDEIRVSIKKAGSQTAIYTLSELENDVLLSVTSEALEEAKYTVRIWVKNESSLPSGSTNHYHGLIQVVENDELLAVVK